MPVKVEHKVGCFLQKCFIDEGFLVQVVSQISFIVNVSSQIKCCAVRDQNLDMQLGLEFNTAALPFGRLLELDTSLVAENWPLQDDMFSLYL